MSREMTSNEMVASLFRIKDELEKIDRRYNGDFDLIPGGPSVTWAEMELKVHVLQLANVVESMVIRVSEIDAWLHALEIRVYR